MVLPTKLTYASHCFSFLMINKQTYWKLKGGLRSIYPLTTWYESLSPIKYWKICSHITHSKNNFCSIRNNWAKVYVNQVHPTKTSAWYNRVPWTGILLYLMYLLRKTLHEYFLYILPYQLGIGAYENTQEIYH